MGAKASCPCLTGSSAPRGAPALPSLAGARQAGRGKAGNAPLIQSCLGSPSLLCPRILSQKWEKNSPSQGLPPNLCRRMRSQIQREAGKNLTGAQKEKNQNHEDFWKSMTRFGCRPALIASTEAPGCRVVPGLAPPPPRAVQTELGSPHKCQGTPKPPRGVFPFRPPPRKREARAGQYSPRRREFLSSGTES